MAKPKLDSTHPKVAKEWHPTKNGELKPSNFTYGSHKEIWWKCPKGDDHEWSARISNRTFKGYGCPCCSGKKTCKDNRLDLLYQEIAKQWHPTNNGDLKPSNFTYGSSKEIWWKCPKGDDHEWETKIKTRTSGHGCPFCSGDKPCKDNRLDLLYPEIAKQWHPTQNGDLKPSVSFMDQTRWFGGNVPKEMTTSGQLRLLIEQENPQDVLVAQVENRVRTTDSIFCIRKSPNNGTPQRTAS